MAAPIEQVPTATLLQWAELREGPQEIRGWDIIVLSAILGTACIVVVASRLWVRIAIQNKPDISDWFTVIALVCSSLALHWTLW